MEHLEERWSQMPQTYVSLPSQLCDIDVHGKFIKSCTTGVEITDNKPHLLLFNMRWLSDGLTSSVWLQ